MMTSRQYKALRAWISRKITELGLNMWAMAPYIDAKGILHEAPILRRLDDGTIICSCAGFPRDGGCKHTEALIIHLGEGPPKQGYENVTGGERLTYPQDWPRYRLAQRILNEAAELVLHSLIHHKFPVVKRESKNGRPKIEKADLLLAATLRSLHRESGAVAQARVDALFEDGTIVTRHGSAPRPPSESAITLAMRNGMFADLNALLQHFAHKVKTGGTVFAVDSKDFYTRNIAPFVPGNAKPKELRRTSLKAHIIVCTKTKLCLGARITGAHDGDAPEFIPLVESILGPYKLDAVAADKAYISNEILEYLEHKDAYAAIPPKSNHVPHGEAALARHVRAWALRSDEEKELWGKRQLVECFNSMMARNVSGELRSRTVAAQRAEVLAIILVTNAIQFVHRYIEDPTFDAPFLNAAARAKLDAARASVAHLPVPSKAPKPPRSANPAA